MSNSYKFYSDTKDIMKKYVNATEGAIIYGISKSRIMVLASEAGAVYKVGNSALINTDIFEMYVLIMLYLKSFLLLYWEYYQKIIELIGISLKSFL